MWTRKINLIVCLLISVFFWTGCARQSVKTKQAFLEQRVATLENRVAQIESTLNSQDRHAVVDIDINLLSPLHQAAYRGEPAKVKQLISQGVDVRTRGYYGLTALHCAAMKGHQATAEVLLDGGADINARNDQGHTAADLAEINGHEETAKFLWKKAL
jgi:ankyrin repeat protein